VIELSSKRIVLRPLRSDELDLWLAERAALGSEAFPGESGEREHLRARIERSGEFRDGEMDLAIETEGRMVGFIQTYRPPGRTLPDGTYEIGVALYDAAERGRGHGTEGVRLFVDWLFEQGAEEVQGGTAVTNQPMRRVFEKLGFSFTRRLEVEGVEELFYGIKRSQWREAASPSKPPRAP
jgi:RimJ/RimL family protein N-acetyltransferase